MFGRRFQTEEFKIFSLKVILFIYFLIQTELISLHLNIIHILKQGFHYYVIYKIHP